MKNRFVVCFFAAFLFMGITFSAFAQSETLVKVQDGVTKFSKDLSKALPLNSLIGLNWSDAYIGKFFPDSPHHFGVGLSLGATTVDPSAVKAMVSELGGDFSLDLSILPLPAYTVEGRLGGFSLPFDIGVKFGYLPADVISIQEIDVNYILVGADFRYAIVDGKVNPSRPNISVGLGANYLKGGIGGVKMGEAGTYTYAGSNVLSISQPSVSLDWSTTSLEFKAQISKTFSIITPYLGAGVNYSWSDAGYSVNAAVKLNGKDPDEAEINKLNDFLVLYGQEPIVIDKDGFKSSIPTSALNARAFGGVSLNLAAFRLDLTGLFSFLDQNFGATLGLRFQL